MEEGGTEEEEGGEERGRRRWSAAARARYYAAQFMEREWMVDVPHDLPHCWLVMPRPEGKRCLVISARTWTVSRLKTGRMLHRFPSALPNGSRRTAASGDVYCVLDCVFHEPNATYYITDVMCWKGYSLYDCSAEFRQYWLHSKLPETDAAMQPHAGHTYRFQALQSWKCDDAGLREAYSVHQASDFQMDGLIFLHDAGHYILGQSPLAMLWKDASCSRYVIDTDADGNVPAQQSVVLTYSTADGCVRTGDAAAPIVLGKLPQSFTDALGSKLRDGTLMRFTIGDGGIWLAHDGEPCGADLKFCGVCSSRRGRADVFSKIVFQYMARHAPLTFDALLHTAQHAADDASMQTDVTADNTVV